MLVIRIQRINRLFDIIAENDSQVLNMQLNQAKSGERILLNSIPATIKAELIRMGLSEGDKVECLVKIPGGPIVLLKDLQEIAIGNNYAKEIQISKV